MYLINVPCMWWDFICVLFSSSMLDVSVSAISWLPEGVLWLCTHSMNVNWFLCL